MSKNVVNITGVVENASGPIIGKISKEKEQVLVITPSEEKAQKLARDLSFFTDKNIYVLPRTDNPFINYKARSKDYLINRLNALKALREGTECIVIAPILSAIRRVVPLEELKDKNVVLQRGKEISLEELKNDLSALGYERTHQVEGKGQCSFRGGILDIFTPDSDDPYRIDLFGNEIDSIKTFDVDSQRSKLELKSVKITPAEELLVDKTVFDRASRKIKKEYEKAIEKALDKTPEIARKIKEREEELLEFVENFINIQLLEGYLQYFYDKTDNIWDYIQNGTIVLDNPERILEILDLNEKETEADIEALLERGQIIPYEAQFIEGKNEYFELLKQDELHVLTTFPKKIKGLDTFSKLYDVKSRQMLNFGGQMDMFEDELKRYCDKKYEIHLVLSTDNRLENIRNLVDDNKIIGNLVYEIGELSGGVDFPEAKICYITDNDIFSYKNKRKKKRKANKLGQTLHSFTDLKTGDYVVHEGYGIGKFVGIVQESIEGEVSDYMKIQYAGNCSVYIPVQKFDVVQKYIGAEGKAPRLNNLNDSRWETTKRKAQEAIDEMADELIELYAKRSIKQGYSFGEDTVWQKEFEDTFPYEETDDQLRCIQEMKEDMEKPEPMDRLLCGDVGYGKTEVAARGIFKCLADGKQAVILVPTTILANQHYFTLKERFEKFPFKVEMLSRFRTKSQQEKVIKGLKDGSVDLVIGTHRLLSDDVEFKDLGLLVIDEEQRFGVRHKEKLKSLKENVDVLTLSATPIPRTLNMSLTGIKKISVINEPPEDRYPVQTYVVEQSIDLICDIIRREIGRGGQVFVVNNRIQSIPELANYIDDAISEAQVATGHGRMNEETLENVMMGFIEGESNVFVSTTIIESGIDIPNANTIIVLNADNFGLSQLYQLRGRVGRSNRMAYAYLMYEKGKVLSEVQEKRLKAMKDFTEFGAGFKIAMKDLEFRGAGNLLGSKQSGHMVNVGYELYCKMVNETVKRLKGEETESLYQDAAIEGADSAYIPGWYIENETLKLEMYKKIMQVTDQIGEDEMVAEFEDRFGPVPPETIKLIKVARIKHLADKKRIREVRFFESKASVKFDDENDFSPQDILKITEKFGYKVSVDAGTKPSITLITENDTKYDDVILLLETFIN